MQIEGSHGIGRRWIDPTRNLSRQRRSRVYYRLKIYIKRDCICQSKNDDIFKKSKRKKSSDRISSQDFKDYNEDAIDANSLKQEQQDTSRQLLAQPYMRRAEIKSIHRRLEQAYNAQKLTEVVRKDLMNMDRWNTCTAIYRLARMYRIVQQNRTPDDVVRWRQTVAGPLVKEMEGRIMELIPRYNCIDISLTVWSFGVLNIYHPSILPALVKQAHTCVDKFKAQDCSTMLWGLARLDYQDEPILLEMCKIAERVLTQFKPQELSNYLWANAKLGYYPGDVFLAQALGRLRRMDLNAASPQELINIIWALAFFNQFTVIIQENTIVIMVSNLLQRTHEFVPQDISNLAWSLVRLDYPDPLKVIAVLSRLAVNVLPEFKPQELAGLLYAQVKSKFQMKSFLLAVDDLIAKNGLQNFTDWELTILLWAFGRMQFLPSEPFLQVLNTQLIERLPYMSPKNYVNIAKSYARLAYDPGLVLYRLAREAEQKLDSFDVMDISNLIFAYAKLHRKDEGLVDAIAINTERRFKMFDNKQLASIIRSCETLGYNPVALQYLAESRQGSLV
eukprot:TRINITY_DN2960_c1_g2_i14.p2 TRINITY_DN2960_c1_g2~~TRINITY_DN2960_c1_g2_i14.p2  ORF type:complete len:560 (+),score=37.69 TRINITY_DN2960_c1_g2_i14:293-1972(+)